MSVDPHWVDTLNDLADPVSSNGANHVVLMVEDYQDARPELKQVLQLRGYRVIDADNGQDAAQQARQTHPHLLVVDMDVPLLYGLMAARQIIRRAEVGPMPAVIVTHEDVVDPAALVELRPRRNEYVTRLSDYQELHSLLNYLLPVLPADDGAERASSASEPVGLPLLATSAPALRPRRADEPDSP